MTTDTIAPLRSFVTAMTALVDQVRDEAPLLAQGRGLLAQLLADDGWLPEAFAQPRADRYAQYLLHCDPAGALLGRQLRLGSGPGDAGAQPYRLGPGGCAAWRGGLRGVRAAGGASGTRGAAACDAAGRDRGGVAHRGDWHRVRHAWDARPAVSIHVYGANIGAVRRHRLDAEGRLLDFVSGYDNTVVPNLWDRSAIARTPVPAC
jgi:predicted metal-dependent enzyme (double-stranded beta helix superfamily)